MKSLKTLATAFCLVALCFLAVPKATADDWNRETVITFSGPVEVPGVGAQILLACGVQKMKLLGNPRRMPSMMGYGLETVGYISKDSAPTPH